MSFSYNDYWKSEIKQFKTVENSGSIVPLSSSWKKLLENSSYQPRDASLVKSLIVSIDTRI